MTDKNDIKEEQEAQDIVNSVELGIINHFAAYDPEPPVNLADIDDDEISEILKVIKRNTKVEHDDRIRIRKLTYATNQCLSQYSNSNRDRCRFCSSIEVAFLNPLYMCVRCFRGVCFTCRFFIHWDSPNQIICAHCLTSINVDNRIGKWFTILSEENNRLRVSPRIYFNQLLAKVKKKKTVITENEWIGVDQAIARMNKEEIKSLESLSQKHGEYQTAYYLPESETSQPSISLSIDYVDKESMFEIVIGQCLNLPNVIEKPPNVFVKVNIEPQYLKNKHKPKSKVILENNNPVFNEKLRIQISHKKIRSGNLMVYICSFNKMSKSTILGEVIIPINRTLNRNKSGLISYKIKPLEVILSSLVDKKMAITRWMDGLSPTSLHHEKKPSTFNEPRKELFVTDAQLLTNIKCDLIGSTYHIHLQLETLYNVPILLDCETEIDIIVTLKELNDREVSSTDKCSIYVDAMTDPLPLKRELLFSNLKSDMTFDTIDMQLYLLARNGTPMASSYNSFSSVLAKIQENHGTWFPINFKIRKL